MKKKKSWWSAFSLFPTICFTRSWTNPVMWARFKLLVLSAFNLEKFTFFPWSKELTLYQTTNFRLFKLKDFADDNFIYYENGRKFFKRIDNTVGKGEIAHYEQFLLFPQCFQKTCTADTKNPWLVWESVKQHTASGDNLWNSAFYLTLYIIQNWTSLEGECCRKHRKRKKCL